jgi:hypothetical protein
MRASGLRGEGVCVPAVVTLRNVLVLRESDDALLCRIEEHERWIPRDKLSDGTTIRRKGDTGTLVLPQQFAVEWGLTPYDG